jgi:cleavage stimulation factor subunit 3
LSKEGVILVDRYKYLDMYPCTEMEMKAMEHPDVQVTSGKRGGEVAHDRDIVEPDLAQMMPFRPSTVCGVGMNAIPGGYFPPPEAVSSLLQRLPPPEYFKGPFVDVGRLMDSIVMNIPEHPHALSTLELRSKIKEGEDRSSRKRPATEGPDAPVRDTPNGVTPPTHDLFRVRQQKRANLSQN